MPSPGLGGGCLPKVQQERPGCSNDFLDGVSGEPRLCVHTHTHTLSAWPRGRAAAPQSPLPGGPGQLSVASSCSPQHSYTHADLTCSGPLAAGGRGAHQEGCWVPQWGWWTCPGSQTRGDPQPRIPGSVSGGRGAAGEPKAPVRLAEARTAAGEAGRTDRGMDRATCARQVNK